MPSRRWVRRCGVCGRSVRRNAQFCTDCWGYRKKDIERVKALAAPDDCPGSPSRVHEGCHANLSHLSSLGHGVRPTASDGDQGELAGDRMGTVPQVSR